MVKKVTVLIEEEQYNRLRQESFDKHISISELVRTHLNESKLPITSSEFIPKVFKEIIDNKFQTEPKEVTYEKFEDAA